MAAAISILCGLLTVLTNNSGPIFNIYLLNCGLSMNQFVATRAVLMAGKNVAKVGARLDWSPARSPCPVRQAIIHGLQIGVMCLVGIQCAKPIKDRTSPQLYKFFTWGVLLYTGAVSVGLLPVRVGVARWSVLDVGVAPAPYAASMPPIRRAGGANSLNGFSRNPSSR